MATRNFVMKANNGTGWDELLPKTSIAQVEGLSTKLTETETIAKGASRAKTFNTLPELEAWLLVPANTATLKTGDNFYIKAVDVPDYWWDGAVIQELETQKVTLNNSSASVDGLMSKDDYAKLSGIAAGATNVTVLNSTSSTSVSDAAAAAAVKTAYDLANEAKTTADSKAGTTTATTAANGLMSSTDKTRLDGMPIVTSGTVAPSSPKLGDVWYDYNNN